MKRPKTTLSEESYSDGLTHIIKRDYYPGLLEAEAQDEYLDAVSSKDPVWIAEASRRLDTAQTPGRDGRRGRRGVTMTPSAARSGETPRDWRGETPLSVVSAEDGTTAKDKPEVDLSLSLSNFQAKYTSEDNEDACKVFDKINVEIATKKAWMYNGNKISTERQIAWRERQARIEAGKQDNASSKDRQLMLRSKDDDERPAIPQSWKHQARNTLMFNPESIEDSQVTFAQAAELKSNAPPKAIAHQNTRIAPPSSNSEGVVPASPSMSAIDAAIAGRPRGTETDPGYDGSETPRVNGYAFVDENPTSSEMGIPVADEIPDTEALLARLGKADPSRNPFDIKVQSKREDVRDRLVDKHKQSRATSSGMGLGERLAELQGTPLGKTPTPKFSSAPGMRQNLTPAGQKLLNRVGTPKRESAFGQIGKTSSGLKKAWTPAVTPKVKR